MTDEPKKRKQRQAAGKEQAAEPRSPGNTVAREQKDLPGEGELPRREDMGPGDHRPRKEGDEGS